MRKWRQWRHVITSVLGRLAAATRYNRVDFVTVDRVPFCRKRRCWFSGPLLIAGNLWLDWQRAGVKILPFEAWRKREDQLWAQLYGQQVRVTGGALWFPMQSGEPLGRWLRGPRTESEQLQAVASASLALAALHQLECADDHDRMMIATHGDAVLANALYEASTNRAIWIDFETLQHSATPRAGRIADDLRALLCSSAECLPDVALPALVDAVLLNHRHADTEVVTRLHEQLDREVCRPCSYHAAQANVSLDRLLALRDEVAKWSRSHD